MRFLYSEWEKLCNHLAERGVRCVTARSLMTAQESMSSYICLKHDVESMPSKALCMARIEAKYNHQASYYVRAYLMTESNLEIFKEIQRLGHEVTYHHEVMDLSKGDIPTAIAIYEKDIAVFEKFGFPISTVCQHGNPTSIYKNRDFFRNAEVRKRFEHQADLMVNYIDRIRLVYTYISDVGMKFKIVKDPMNPEMYVGDDEYIEVGEVDQLINLLDARPDESFIISSHPHRYSSRAVIGGLRRAVFMCIKNVARILFLIPELKKMIFRCHSLTKFI